MDFSQHMNILRKSNSDRKVSVALPIIQEAIKSCLAPSKERILVITDIGENNNLSAGILGAAYYTAFGRMGNETAFISQKPKTSMNNSDPKIEKKMEEMESGDIVILCVSNKLGRLDKNNKSFRKFAADRGFRFISATSLGMVENGDFDLLLNSIGIDYAKLRNEQEPVKKMLDETGEIHVTSEAGTDIWFKARKNTAISNDGNYVMPGAGGNVPAGEVYLPPIKGTPEGTIVVDGSSRNEFGTWIVKTPIRITVDKGFVASMEGGKEAKLLEAGLLLAEDRSEHPENVRCLAELGIGFNPGAKIIGSMIVDEKTRGTCHFAIGSNYWFGGDNHTIVHFDQVVRNPKIEVDGNVLDAGKGKQY